MLPRYYNHPLINLVREWLTSQDEDTKSHLKDNHNTTEVLMVIRFLNGDYDRYEEELFLEYFKLN